MKQGQLGLILESTLGKGDYVGGFEADYLGFGCFVFDFHCNSFLSSIVAVFMM